MLSLSVMAQLSQPADLPQPYGSQTAAHFSQVITRHQFLCPELGHQCKVLGQGSSRCTVSIDLSSRRRDTVPKAVLSKAIEVNLDHGPWSGSWHA